MRISERERMLIMNTLDKVSHAAERKAMDLGLKAVEAGAEIADKVADEADKVAGKAKDKWGK